MGARLKIITLFSGWKKAWLVMFGLLLLSFIPGTSYAQCGFDSIGDYTCRGPTGGAGAGGGGGGPITGIGGQYSVGDYILNMPDAPNCSILSQLPLVMDQLPPAVQGTINAQSLNFLAGGATCAEITEYGTNLLFFQAILNGLPLDPCGMGPDETGNDVTNDAIMALIYNSVAQDLASGGSLDVLDLTATVTQACAEIEPSCGNAAAPADDGAPAAPGGESCTPVNSATIEDDIIEHLKSREGVRSCAYQDSEGHWTIGVGHLITDADPYARSTSTCISDAEVDSLLRSDMAWAQSAAQSQMAELGLNCHEFLIDLVSVNYQLGSGWRSKFPTTWSQMRQGQYSEAADGLEGSLWNQQTPVRVDDFQQGLRQLDGISPAAACPGAAGAGDPAAGGDDSQPGADALGRWCLDAGAAGYATDAESTGTYTLSETNNARRIAESAALAIGATTGDHDGVTSPSSGTRGGLGCALAVSRILRCAGVDGIYSLATNGLWDQMEGDACWTLADTGPLDMSTLQPGDVINVRTAGTPGGNGHVGIYVGDGNIISNSSSGFAGSDGSRAGGVMQNYTVDTWNSSVVTRTNNPASHSGTFRYTC